jgi:hypothetical protein
MSQPQFRPRAKPPVSALHPWNAGERQAQVDRVLNRAVKQQERRKVATPGPSRRRQGER